MVVTFPLIWVVPSASVVKLLALTVVPKLVLLLLLAVISPIGLTSPIAPVILISPVPAVKVRELGDESGVLLTVPSMVIFAPSNSSNSVVSSLTSVAKITLSSMKIG